MTVDVVTETTIDRPYVTETRTRMTLRNRG
jgi:hypothetical protein